MYVCWRRGQDCASAHSHKHINICTMLSCGMQSSCIPDHAHMLVRLLCVCHMPVPELGWTCHGSWLPGNRVTKTLSFTGWNFWWSAFVMPNMPWEASTCVYSVPGRSRTLPCQHWESTDVRHGVGSAELVLKAVLGEESFLPGPW